jgi:hypothetical protein
MKLGMVVRSVGVTALALTTLSGGAKGQGTVRVAVAESAADSATRYVYRVENRTTQPIVGVRVGFDWSTDQPQFHEAPLGWTFDAGLPPSSGGAPQGWTLRVVTTEESDIIYLDWSNDGDPQWDIAPGTSVGGFSVTLARPSAEYRTARFDAVLGNATHVTGTLMSGDPHGAGNRLAGISGRGMLRGGLPNRSLK